MAAKMPLTQRRKHQKSRVGCQSCKARRVKCDELQPSCGNCKARKTECVYQNLRITTVQSSGKIETVKRLGFPSLPITQLPVNPDNSIELKLLHQWTTETYKSLITPSNMDHDVWQSQLPQTALGCEYLLHSLFAFSAFDLAKVFHSEHNKWVAIALHYQDQAFRGFRQYFNDMDQGNHEGAMYFSLLVIVLNLASIQLTPRKGKGPIFVDSIGTYYKLIRGTQLFLKRNWRFFSKHALFRNIKTINQIPRYPIDSKAQEVVAVLTRENDRRSPAPTHDDEQQATARQHQDACKRALMWLEECFATCQEPDYQMYCEVWIPLAGESFFAAVKDRDPIALLILACWGTLLQRLGQQAWWAKNYGRELLTEIKQLLPEGGSFEAQRILTWAEEEIACSSQGINAIRAF